MTQISTVRRTHVMDRRVFWTFGVGGLVLLAFLVSLVVRQVGAYNTLVDGWGVDAFELAMGALCLSRYFEKSWRTSSSVARMFPLVLGAACISWAIGDVALTIESLGGATASVPSAADAFYIGFFVLAYLSFTMVIRRGTSGSLVATSLDAVVAGLATAAIVAAYVFHAVTKVSGDGSLAAATKLIYPVGDLLLLALAIGGMALLPRAYTRFLVIAATALAVNATGDMFNLLNITDRIGYISNAIAWPIALFMLALATWVQPGDTWVAPVNTAATDTERTAGFEIAAFGAMAALVVLTSASAAHISRVAVGLATATLLVAGMRLTLTVRQAQALNSARFRYLIDNAWDMIVVAEADLSIAYCTPSSRRVLGYGPGELRGRAVTELVHPDDAAMMTDRLRDLEDSSAFETRMRHRDGAWRTVAWTATNRLGDPSVHGYVLNGGDVTEARQASEDLAAARDEALMASRAKSEFLSIMSHEIRTPMNGVIGLTELLLGTDLDHNQLELASGVKVSAESLLTIINDILDFSKIEAGKLDIEEAEIDVPGLVDDVGRIVAGAAHGKGIELLVDVHPDVPSALLGDAVRMQQVLLNLSSNAVKFTLEGEVVIRVSLLHENAERAALRFDVIDQGIGIAPADQKRLFRAFSQADSSTTRRFGGTGLGLAICRQLVELMGGKLGLVSAPGKGSTFWFELSLKRAETAPRAEPTDASADLTGLKALVVDDNATNRKILRQQLLSWGVEPVEAFDAYQAMGLAAAAAEAGRPFDLGVVDLNMPGMDGIELAEILKADPATAATTLFLLSSSGDRLSPAESHLRGFAASLTKPVRQSELFDCLITSLHGDLVADEAAPRRSEPSEGEGVVLLVEDNKMNQMVGSKVLAKLGYAFDIANHGAEAVAAVQVRRYDAILMDCQMPEMDGYEATAAIRRLEGSGRRTPIVAMTAAAMEGDREKCMAAGMDDYLTKPVRPDAVAEVLARWVIRTEAPSGASAPLPATGLSPDEDALEVLDPAQIEFLRSLDSGDGAVLSEIIEQYRIQAAEGRDELVRTFAAGDAQAVRRAAHTLKGASANLGARALAAVCGELEARGQREQLEEAAGLVERLDAEMARVTEALDALTARA